MLKPVFILLAIAALVAISPRDSDLAKCQEHMSREVCLNELNLN